MTARAVDRRAPLFAIALTLIHLALGLYAAYREGSFSQCPSVDQSGDLTSALSTKRAIEARGISGFFESWTSGNQIHTPVVQCASALVMLVAGESRYAAEAVLPLFTLLLVWATFRVVEQLYGARTAYAATALTTAFPLFLIFSRTYLFEHPLAAVFAATCWAMLRTEGFTRTGPTILFGVLAGLTSVTRGGAPVYLVGPTLVAGAVALRSAPRGPKLARIALATLIGAGVAATWYVPSWNAFTEYIGRVTYGEEAEMKAGGSSAFSWDNAVYYAQWIVIQGPGIPMAALIVLAFLLRPSASPTMLALWAAFAIDFVLLLIAAQREGARYFQPLMPIVAVSAVRAVANVPWRLARGALAAGVSACALHHVVALTFLFPVPGNWDDALGPYPGFPWWDHRSWFCSVALYSGMTDTRADMKVGAVVDRLEELSGGKPARFLLVSKFHGFFHVPALNYEIKRRRRFWYGIDTELSSPDVEAWLKKVAGELENVDFLFTRSDETSGAVDEGTLVRRAFDPVWCPFTETGEPIRLGDGTIVRSFRRPPHAVQLHEMPEDLTPVHAEFGREGVNELELIGVRDLEGPRGHKLTLAFRLNRGWRGLPAMTIQAVDGDETFAERAFDPIGLDLDSDAEVVVVKRFFTEPIPEKNAEHGYRFALVLARRDGNRLPVRSDQKIDEDDTRVTIASVPPHAR